MTSILLVCSTGLLIFVPACTDVRESEVFLSPHEHGFVTSIFVVNHGMHAGIILKRSAFPEAVLHEDADFPEAKFLEIGWGDKDYYQASDPHIGLLLKAALLPTAGVIHIVGFNSNPAEFFPNSELIRIDLTGSAMEQLGLYIGNSFAKNDKGFTQVMGAGLYGDSYFYLSQENYHLLKTCNVWVARALQSAGIPINSFLSVSTDNLMGQLYEYGEIVQK